MPSTRPGTEPRRDAERVVTATLPPVPRGLLLRLQPGEWYDDGRPATTATTVRVFAIDRMAPRLRGLDYEFWVSAHTLRCTPAEALKHPPCASSYVPRAAIERHLREPTR